MDGISNEIILLLTGTIKPNSLNTLVIKDPGIRKTQYLQAIKYYLANTNFKIVFAENSGTSLENEFTDSKNRLEFLTFLAPPTIPDRGKGFKELEIMEYAIKNSNLISNTNVIVKITGRLKILNINVIGSSFLFLQEKKQRLLSCNIYKNSKMDSRCFIFTKDFWGFLNKAGQHINLKYSFERALWDAAIQYNKIDSTVFKQLKQPLRIEGFSAGFGTSYKDSFLTVIIKKGIHYKKTVCINRKLR